jgi:hypothetical protein
LGHGGSGEAGWQLGADALTGDVIPSGDGPGRTGPFPLSPSSNPSTLVYRGPGKIPVHFVPCLSIGLKHSSSPQEARRPFPVIPTKRKKQRRGINEHYDTFFTAIEVSADKTKGAENLRRNYGESDTPDVLRTRTTAKGQRSNRGECPLVGVLRSRARVHDVQFL